MNLFSVRSPTFGNKYNLIVLDTVYLLPWSAVLRIGWNPALGLRDVHAADSSALGDDAFNAEAKAPPTENFW